MTGAVLAHFWYLPGIPLLDALTLALVGGFLGQLGDFGRIAAQARGGGEILGRDRPGHGGMLDRLDALFVTSAVVYLYTLWR